MSFTHKQRWQIECEEAKETYWPPVEKCCYCGEDLSGDDQDCCRECIPERDHDIKREIW